MRLREQNERDIRESDHDNCQVQAGESESFETRAIMQYIGASHLRGYWCLFRSLKEM